MISSLLGMVSNFSVITYLRCFSFSASLCSPEGDSRKQLPWFTRSVSPSVVRRRAHPSGCLDVSSPAYTIFPQHTQNNVTYNTITHHSNNTMQHIGCRVFVQCEVDGPKTMTKTRDKTKTRRTQRKKTTELKRITQDTKHGHIGNNRMQGKTTR
jgi:hypothetical protein